MIDWLEIREDVAAIQQNPPLHAHDLARELQLLSSSVHTSAGCPRVTIPVLAVTRLADLICMFRWLSVTGCPLLFRSLWYVGLTACDLCAACVANKAKCLAAV